MKLQNIKTEVFRRVGVSSTIALKRQHSYLTKGRDLRYKSQWLEIHSILQDDLTLEDLDRQEIELKQSLHRMGRLAGTSFAAVEETWRSIQEKSQADDLDITLAELEV